MNKQSQIEQFDRFVEKQREVMLSKGDDYANTDRLSNFKFAGQICGLTAEQHCLAMIATKVARLGVLLDPKGPVAKNESIEDSVLDLANYAQLLNMILIDTRVNQGEPKEYRPWGGALQEIYFTVKNTCGDMYEISKGKKYTIHEARKICETIYGNSYTENFEKIFTPDH